MTAASGYVEVVEGISAVIAAHAHAQDDNRISDLVALYCSDGIVEVSGVGTFEGTAAVREAYAGWRAQAPQRHLVVNTLVTEWSEESARSLSDFVFVARDEAGWSVQLVGRYDDTFHNRGGAWLIHRRSMAVL